MQPGGPAVRLSAPSPNTVRHISCQKTPQRRIMSENELKKQRQTPRWALCLLAEGPCQTRQPKTGGNGRVMPEISSSMRGKRGLIMGVANNRSIAWASPVPAATTAGADLAFTYQGEALKKRVERLAEEVDGLVVGHCDVTEPATIDARAFAAVKSAWGSARFRAARDCVLGQGPARRPLCRHDRGQFRQDRRR